ncbi:MAG: hypothetical protein GY711_33960 [bacterium]|nr:hypothetical protein [bacterium]
MFDLTALGVSPSTGTLRFLPNGTDVKIASFSASTWYDASVAPDGNGTFDLVGVTQSAALSGGPEGIVYIDGSNPGFSADSVLVSEFSSNRVSAYEVDANDDPLPATRRDFLTSLSGAEGAATDPLTGEWLGEATLSGPDDFVVCSNQVANNTFGIMMWSVQPDNVSMFGGTLCVAAPMFRFPIANSGGSAGLPASDCSGQFIYPVTQAWMTSQGFTAGTTVYTQFISRDPGFVAPNAVSLSNALASTIQP